ncbi:uncharacterized protein N7487_007576 [Penicillium crustosum]|uniref:uncharacterized protein n=1 Tax=Penicillium crustosum TaxID=36656 RepID=UPI00238A10CC|nr:uncharacterized protein N7487_007576 [Penicillium crustosum]KAJ5401680.1 hypothetical protein N7487_007576 [Penicillium crustosum]
MINPLTPNYLILVASESPVESEGKQCSGPLRNFSPGTSRVSVPPDYRKQCLASIADLSSLLSIPLRPIYSISVYPYTAFPETIEDLASGLGFL